MTTIAVHNGSFHADDVFASAILQLVYKNPTIVRTRDPQVLAKADLRVDIGLKHDPTTGDFDHHQPGGAGERENGIPYASAGLVWQHFGQKLVATKEAFDHIDEKLLQHIDAVDNGISTYEVEKATPYTISRIIRTYNPHWQDEEQDQDAAFFRAVAFAKDLLEREITRANSYVAAKEIVEKALKASDGKIVILEKFCPWKSFVSKESDALYVIYQTQDKQWRVQGVPVEPDNFAVRKPLPAAWGGLDNKKLQEVTGVQDAVFCHKALFLCGAMSKAGAIALAALALRD